MVIYCIYILYLHDSYDMAFLLYVMYFYFVLLADLIVIVDGDGEPQKPTVILASNREPVLVWKNSWGRLLYSSTDLQTHTHTHMLLTVMIIGLFYLNKISQVSPYSSY